MIIATGSEVALALAAQEQPRRRGLPVRVVSMPATSVFDRQDAAYREAVLPRGVPRVAVEAGVPDFWRKYVGLEGAVVGMRPLRRIGAGQRTIQAFRIHTGQGRRGGEGDIVDCRFSSGSY